MDECSIGRLISWLAEWLTRTDCLIHWPNASPNRLRNYWTKMGKWAKIMSVWVKGTNCIVWRAWMRYVYESTLMKGWKMWMKWIKWVKNHTRTVPSKNRKKSNTKYWMQDWTKSLAELDATHDMNVMNEVTEMSWMGWSPEGNEPNAKNTENRRT